MVSRSYSVAFEGVDARLVEIQCAISAGLPAFSIVGLPDKAVSEARERVRSALTVMGMALPGKKITINLSPADMAKGGSHFDLPIALALLAEMEVLPKEDIAARVAIGELSLDGKLIGVSGALPGALAAASEGLHFVCPKECGAEAAWVGDADVTAPANLMETIGHFTGKAPLSSAKPGEVFREQSPLDLMDVKGQERAKRALEVAAAGRHHMMMLGSPGSGKSMMAARLSGLLPPLTAEEALETSMIHSLAGLLGAGGISRTRPFRDPHHTASMAAIIGGGRGALPGEVSLAHNGVLFLDELPEFPRTVLDTLRQPLETGEVMVARANAHVRYPCRFMLMAAANPCRCGYLPDPERACGRAPICGQDYLGKISGPMMDRIDIRIEVPPVEMSDLSNAPSGEKTETVAARVADAWARQAERYKSLDHIRQNADLGGQTLEEVSEMDAEARDFLLKAAEFHKLTGRGYHRILRVSRTIADLDGSDLIRHPHVAEAVYYRFITKS